jgi:hypothetical protein
MALSVISCKGGGVPLPWIMDILKIFLGTWFRVVCTIPAIFVVAESEIVLICGRNDSHSSLTLVHSNRYTTTDKSSVEFTYTRLYYDLCLININSDPWSIDRYFQPRIWVLISNFNSSVESVTMNLIIIYLPVVENWLPLDCYMFFRSSS